MKNCQACEREFEIYPEDANFYERIKVPEPTFCPECRLVRRLIWRNERALYKRPCDLCRKDKILMYRRESGYKAYCFSCWYGDGWDREAYGRDYDFSKTFFSQFAELLRDVPRPGVIQQGNIINSDYANRVSDPKNSYLVFNSISPEDCTYSSWVNFSKDCMDCFGVLRSEFAYDSTDCYNSYELMHSQDSDTCRSSSFLINCRNSDHCIGSVNLRNKSYCIFNEQYSKEDFEKKRQELALDTREGVRRMHGRMAEFAKDFVKPHMVERQSVGSTGNWIENSKNVRMGFACTNVEDGAYLYGIQDGKDLWDYTFWSSGSERVYESINTGRQCADVAFVNECWDQVRSTQYSMNCHNSSDLFGCVGLKNKRYCILNKQYSKEEYEALREKIIRHMSEVPYADKKGRVYGYGEFFPAELSPFAYNETMAQDWFPSGKAEAEELGFSWREPEARQFGITLSADKIPEKADDSILKEIIGCAHGGKCSHNCVTAFKIIPSELQFYKRFNLPLPDICHNCRHYERLSKRNPIRLWSRTCACPRGHDHGESRCPNEFETSYAPERTEPVYCLACYNAEIG